MNNQQRMNQALINISELTEEYESDQIEREWQDYDDARLDQQILDNN